MKVIFPALFVFLLLNCSSSSSTTDTVEALARRIVESIKENDEDKFITNYASYDDHVSNLKNRNLEKDVESKLMEGINAYKNKYAQNPRDNFNLIMFKMRRDSIDLSALEIKEINVTSSNSFGYEKWGIDVTFKSHNFTLSITECTNYDRGILCSKNVYLF